jgi:hypothetical protein
MSLIEINRNPSTRQLRQFGAVCLVALPLIGWWWGASAAAIGMLAATGAAIAVGGWFVPGALRPLFLLLTLVTAPLGIVVGEATLVLLYFAVFLPIGLLLRAFRSDPLERKFDREAPSYWKDVETPQDAASYYRLS